MKRSVNEAKEELKDRGGGQRKEPGRMGGGGVARVGRGGEGWLARKVLRTTWRGSRDY